MIHEIATIRVKSGTEAAFEAAVSLAAPLFRRSPGCRTMRLTRSIEQPQSYHLVVGWDTVEDHMEGFRNSPEMIEWRALISDYLAAPPEVQHYENIHPDLLSAFPGEQS